MLDNPGSPIRSYIFFGRPRELAKSYGAPLGPGGQMGT
jgi:hypothetical protein